MQQNARSRSVGPLIWACHFNVLQWGSRIKHHETRVPHHPNSQIPKSRNHKAPVMQGRWPQVCLCAPLRRGLQAPPRGNKRGCGFQASLSWLQASGLDFRFGLRDQKSAHRELCTVTAARAWQLKFSAVASCNGNLKPGQAGNDYVNHGVSVLLVSAWLESTGTVVFNGAMPGCSAICGEPLPRIPLLRG